MNKRIYKKKHPKLKFHFVRMERYVPFKVENPFKWAAFKLRQIGCRKTCLRTDLRRSK